MANPATSPPPPPMHHPPPPPPVTSAAAEATKARAQEREALRHVIAQWNANRLDLFELSEPNEDLEFHGVMRFYFQDSGQKVATKCIRVASTAPATAVVETLIEKFRPDMRMLSVPEYALYEIHENGDERRLADDEKPLLVQLNWHKDDREGRFLLRRIDDKTNVPAVSFQEGGSFCRKLSKREKKQLKKLEKMNKLKSCGSGGSIGGSGSMKENDGGVAEKLYTELPETSFTRSISNPEAVMRRRRQQKLERKLQQFRSKDGGPDTGGTLKIYGESLCRDVPYKTLLLSVRDTAAVVVREMLSKYGLSREDPSQYCLIQVNVLGPDNGTESSKEYHGSTNREYILDDDECPLAILMNHPSSRGSIMFHVRRRPADYHPRKRKKKPQQQVGHKGGAKGGGMMIGENGIGNDSLDYRRYEDSYDRLPFLLELNPDGSDIVNGIPKRHRLQLNVTEVGSERSSQSSGVAGQNGGVGGGSQSLQLFGPNVQPRHCVIAHTEGIVTVTPCSRDAETYVNGQRIYETTILQNGAVVKFGRIHNFRFLDPSFEDRMSRHRHDSSRQGHDYSDRQSNKDESVVLGGSMGGVSGSQGNFETTFDVDGHVETVSSTSSSKLQQQQDPDSRSQRSVGSREGNRPPSNYERYPPQVQSTSSLRPPSGTGGGDPILPAALEFREEATDALLDALITSLDPGAAPPHFRLAPTYALYLAARFRASTHYRPELTPNERAHRLTALLSQVAAMIRAVVQERYEDAESLAFWMANASEFLHFLKSDRHISSFSLDAQDILAESVQIAFRNLVTCLQTDLGAVMPNFLADRDDDRNEEESAGSVLQVLASAMALLRRCRVNAALTIQLFSQLFHYVNVWAFNRIIASAVASGSANSPSSPHHHTHHHHPHAHQHHHRPSYCSREWGLRLGARLARVEAWAERQGLELAADCHLSRIAQAAHLLQAPKYNAEELRAISTTCFKLNSLQLRALLTNYQHAPDEPRIPMELVENVIRVAENVCDDLIRNEGREVQLEEEEGELLRLPFLLPDDGYSCDVVRGLPPGLMELLAPLQRANICRLVPQNTSAGFWTVYMTPPPSAVSQQSLGPDGHPQSQMTNAPSHGHRSPSALSNRSGGIESSSSRLHGSTSGHLQGQMSSGQQPQVEPETQVIKLHKSNNGMGLSIVAAKGAGQDRLGIYIKSVVKGGAADADGRLQAGDQLLKVDGQSLVGITQEKAAEYLVRTGPVVTLEVAKQGAIYHGLATLLSQPSPVMTRGPRRMSERDLPSKVQGEYNQSLGDRGRIGSLPPAHMPTIHGSKSVPSLSSDMGAMSIGSTQPNALSDVAPTPQGGARSNMQHSQPTHPQHQMTHIHSHHEVYNPGYSRTSSTNSIPQKSSVYDGGIKSRSSQNLNEPRSPGAHHAMVSRQASNPGLTIHNPQHPPQQQQQQYPMQQNGAQHQQPNPSHQSVEAERFYQNLSIYRSQQPETHNGFTSPGRGKIPNLQGSPDERVSQGMTKPALRGSHSSLHRQYDSGNANQPNTRDRPVSAYIPQNSPQPIQQSVPRSQSARDVLRQEAKLQEMQEEVRRRREGRPGVPIGGAPSGMTSPQQQYQYSNSNIRSHPQLQQRGPQSSGTPEGHAMNHHVHPGHQYPPGGYSPYGQQGPGHGYPSYPSSPGQFSPSGTFHQQLAGPRNPPPTAPKPRTGTPSGGPTQRPGESMELPPVRPPPPEDAYRDSPPPPPPPTSTHPLYQGGNSPSQKPPSGAIQQNESRYTASTGDPPKGSFYPSTGSALSGPPRQFPFTGTNPWDREEKEKEQAKRREAARLWRDRQISELEALGPGGRGPAQEERLRALRLEREFQRRAEEEEARRGKRGEEEDEEEEDDDDDDEGRETKDGSSDAVKTDGVTEQSVSNGNEELNGNTDDPHEGRPVSLLTMVQNPDETDIQSRRPLTLDVSSRPIQHSQYANQQVPVSMPQSYVQHHPIKSLQPGPLRLDNLVINGGSGYGPGGPPSDSSHNNGPHPIQNYQDGGASAGAYPSSPQGTYHSGSGSQRLDSLLLGQSTPTSTSGATGGMSQAAPPPPERGSSFVVMSQQQQQTHSSTGMGVLRSTISTTSANQSSTTPSNSPGMPSTTTTTTTKRVSFHDSKVVTFDDNANHQERSTVREDPNNFINEAQTLLATPRSPDGSFTGNTPGVIGAQEVYRDPRTRRLAEQQKLMGNRTGPLPEKLSFKEKMKMFAMETGEDGTPKDKVKISRAQRDIEGPPNGYGLN